MKQSIEISKKEYEVLLKAVVMAGTIYGILSDMADKKYKKDAAEMDAAEGLLCSRAREFGQENLLDPRERTPAINMESRWYDGICQSVKEYEDFALYDGLANELAWRDFRREHTNKEIEELYEKHHGYLGIPLYEYEKKYWDEFETYDYDRLEIVE